MSEDVLHKKAVVIGAGVSGLCSTHRLMDAWGADQVVCLEKSSRAGGYIQSENIDGYRCDEGPNGFLDKEPAMLEWIESLGISDELIQANEASARRFLFLKGRLVEIKPPPGFLLTPALSIPGRLRLLREPFVPQRTDESPESVWDFAARRIGPEAADNLVSAMVLGVYGGDAKLLSLSHCFPRMAAMEREHGSLIKALKAKAKEGSGQGGPAGPGGVLTTFQSGICRLTERAAEVVESCLHLNTSITGISKSEDGGFVVATETETYSAEKLICSVPAHVAAELLRDVSPELEGALTSIQSEPIAVVCTGHDVENVGHDMRGFGYLVPPNQGRDVLGCIWTSSVFDGFAPEGKVYLRTMIGGAINPEYIAQSDDQLMDYMRKDVFSTMGISTDPEFVKIFRHPHGIPQYGLNHGDVLNVIEKAESKHTGLHLAGNSYHGISMNDCVKEAVALTERVSST